MLFFPPVMFSPFILCTVHFFSSWVSHLALLRDDSTPRTNLVFFISFSYVFPFQHSSQSVILFTLFFLYLFFCISSCQKIHSLSRVTTVLLNLFWKRYNVHVMIESKANFLHPHLKSILLTSWHLVNRSGMRVRKEHSRNETSPFIHGAHFCYVFTMYQVECQMREIQRLAKYMFLMASGSVQTSPVSSITKELA